MPALPLKLLLLASLGLATSCSRPTDDGEEAQESASDGTSQAEASEASLDLDGTPAVEREEEEEEAQLVRVSPLRRGTVERSLQATANVESLDVVDVMPERAEPVTRILAEEGQKVEAGQVLASLRDDNAKLAVAEAEVRVAETKFAAEQAEREFERDQRLVEEKGPTGVLSERDLESRRQTWETAKTAYQTAQVALERAQLELAQCEIKAPIAGTVSSRDISLGDMAAVGTRVFQITDLSQPKVILYRPQRELQSLAVGQTLIATSEALAGSEVVGRIERIAPTVDQQTGTVKVTAALDPAGLRIPAGILVEIDLVLDRHEQVLLIPKEALFHEGDGVYCFAVRDGRAVRIEIFQGYENDDEVEAGEGTALLDEDIVVVVGADRLGEGDAVEIAEE